MPTDRSPLGVVAHAHENGLVIRCHPDGARSVEFVCASLPGYEPGQWLKLFEGDGNSHPVDDVTHVVNIVRLCDPAYELIEESESLFGELRENDDG